MVYRAIEPLQDSSGMLLYNFLLETKLQLDLLKLVEAAKWLHQTSLKWENYTKRKHRKINTTIISRA